MEIWIGQDNMLLDRETTPAWTATLLPLTVRQPDQNHPWTIIWTTPLIWRSARK